MIYVVVDKTDFDGGDICDKMKNCKKNCKKKTLPKNDILTRSTTQGRGYGGGKGKGKAHEKGGSASLYTRSGALKSETPCYYEQQPGGCSMGDNCMWKHVGGATQAPAPKAKAKAKAKTRARSTPPPQAAATEGMTKEQADAKVAKLRKQKEKLDARFGQSRRCCRRRRSII